jgi:hypothetical protein
LTAIQVNRLRRDFALWNLPTLRNFDEHGKKLPFSIVLITVSPIEVQF